MQQTQPVAGDAEKWHGEDGPRTNFSIRCGQKDLLLHVWHGDGRHRTIRLARVQARQRPQSANHQSLQRQPLTWFTSHYRLDSELRSTCPLPEWHSHCAIEQRTSRDEDAVEQYRKDREPHPGRPTGTCFSRRRRCTSRYPAVSSGGRPGEQSHPIFAFRPGNKAVLATNHRTVQQPHTFEDILARDSWSIFCAWSPSATRGAICRPCSSCATSPMRPGTGKAGAR